MSLNFGIKLLIRRKFTCIFVLSAKHWLFFETADANMGAQTLVLLVISTYPKLT